MLHPVLIVLAAYLIVLPAQPATAEQQELTLSGMFRDHAVIQLTDSVPVWGEAIPGSVVRVKFDDVLYDAVTDERGRWMTSIRPREYGGPHTLTVRGNGREVQVNDLLVGEVWLCGGQSNMQWSVAQSGDADVEIKAADWPEVRLYSMPLDVRTEPQTRATGAWAVCTPETAADFSAAAYYFGRHLRRELDVPVGLVLIAWGGARPPKPGPAGLQSANSRPCPLSFSGTIIISTNTPR